MERTILKLSLLLVVGIFTILQFSCSGTKEYSPKWGEEDRAYLLSKLDSSLNLVIAEVEDLEISEWNWQPDSVTWPVAKVVEHLIIHDALFYREVRVLTALPEPQRLNSSNFAEDSVILGYKDITPKNIGSSPAYLEPHGRWCTKQDAVEAYKRSRKALMEFVKSSDKDLRAYYTASGRGPTKYRDLHQLLLISIAHTLRHHRQIQKLKTFSEGQKE